MLHGIECTSSDDLIRPDTNNSDRSTDHLINDNKRGTIYTKGKTALKFVNISKKETSDGMRDMSKVPLTDKEIEKLKEEIKRIEADESVFVFNDEAHPENTCYNCTVDKVYVSRNVFPDTQYGSIYPRDIMSAAAVLAHEYYGHRPYRDEYLNDLETGAESVPLWEDECRASITAAKITPNLTPKERQDLILDAVFRAKEAAHVIEMDNFMKEIVYGYKFSDDEKHITMPIPRIVYVSEESLEAVLGQQQGQQQNNSDLSKVRKTAKSHDYTER